MHNRWEYFSEDELRCKGTGEIHMNEEFMKKLIALRKEFNQPMYITSGYRDGAYNEVIGGGKTSAHLTGKAVDVACYGNKAYKLIQLAIKHGFTGIGIKQHSHVEKRFVHLDMVEHQDIQPRPWVWSYK
tara:strand:- start:39 stop:425 length:387 start_codon:yes stop_codon:yes gene_type:complete